MSGQPGSLGAHPAFELGHQRRNAGCAHGETLLHRQSVDLALDCEDRVDPAHCRDGERCPRFPARGRLGDIGQDKELPPSMAPAGRLGDWGWTSLWIVKPIEPAIGVGLKKPGIGSEMLPRVLAVAVAGIVEHRGRGCRPGERPIIANIGPHPPVTVLPLARTGTVLSSPCSRAAPSTWRRISSTSGASAAVHAPTQSAMVETSRSMPSRAKLSLWRLSG